MNVGIYAPYGPHEVTAAALRVATHALRNGCAPRLLAQGPPVNGVHPFWDHRVKRGGRQAAYRWALGCDQFFWFHHDPDLLRRAKLVAGRAKHIFVPRWHYLHSLPAQALAEYDYLFCPCAGAKQAVLRDFAVPETKAGWCFWDPGLPPIRSHRLDRPAQQTLFVLVDSYTVEFAGAHVAETLYRLLQEFPHLRVTVEALRAWHPEVRGLWRVMGAQFGQRLRVLKRQNLAARLSLFHGHAWTFVPSLRTDFGLTALQSLACGTPVILHYLQPYADMFHQGDECLFVPSDFVVGPHEAPEARYSTEQSLVVLAEALETQALFEQMRSGDWRLARRSATFDRCLESLPPWAPPRV